MDFKDFLLALYENDYFVIYSLISILVLTILFVLLIVSSRKGSKKKEEEVKDSKLEATMVIGPVEETPKVEEPTSFQATSNVVLNEELPKVEEIVENKVDVPVSEVNIEIPTLKTVSEEPKSFGTLVDITGSTKSVEEPKKIEPNNQFSSIHLEEVKNEEPKEVEKVAEPKEKDPFDFSETYNIK